MRANQCIHDRFSSKGLKSIEDGAKIYKIWSCTLSYSLYKSHIVEKLDKLNLLAFSKLEAKKVSKRVIVKASIAHVIKLVIYDNSFNQSS